ncbi:MAG: hypothetical protein EOP50_17860, partial [Sphingobacteriales bacterium]
MKQLNAAPGAAPSRPQKKTFLRWHSRWLAAILLFAFAAGCKKEAEDTGTVGICPIVVSTTPVAGAINVPTVTLVTATFNEAMDPATINSSTFLLMRGTTPVAGVVTYSGLVATFTPSAPLLANTVYTATVTNGAADPAGTAMVDDYVWSFNTGAVPIVVSTDPANGATDVRLSKIITATFSTTMNPATINGTSFQLRNGTTVVPGTVTYSGMTATFTPTAPLLPATVYTGTITT